MSGFQKQVYVQPAPAVAGDFSSSNPRWTVDFGQGGAVAGPAGVQCGLFAWAVAAPPDSNGAAAVINNYGAGPVTGIIAREQQALLQTYLQTAGNLIPAGFPVTVFSNVDIWVTNSGASQALPGMKAYANFATGAVTFAATATPTAGASATGSKIDPETASVTASVTGNVMTVTAVGSGLIVPGGVLSGAASGTTVVSQLTPLLAGETVGGVGRYYVSIPEQTVASGTITETYGLFTPGTTTGTFQVGNVLAGSGGGGVTTGTTITGVGAGAGTWYVGTTQTVTSSTITSVANVETKWVAQSSGLAGELVKISAQALG